jgi:hypothetical protein
MKCSKCPFYHSEYTFNLCKVTDAECFRQQDNCKLVNDDGTINGNELQDSHPVCYKPNGNPYPLCVGDGSDECMKCCLYEDMDEGHYWDV